MKRRVIHDDLQLHLLLSNFMVIAPDDWPMIDIQSGYWRFYLHLTDGVFISSGGITMPLQAMRPYVIPSEVRFSAWTTAAVGQLFFHFDVHTLYRLVMRELFTEIISVPEPFPLTDLARDIAQRHQEGEKADTVMQTEIKGIIYTALGAYLRSLPEERIEQSLHKAAILEPLMPAIRHIDDHLSETLPIQTLADLCFMSQGHFTRLFRAGVGHTPVEYIMEQRVRYAARRLYMTDDNIDTIAADAGFGSRFYFHRIFTRITGKTPNEYRKAPH